MKICEHSILLACCSVYFIISTQVKNPLKRKIFAKRLNERLSISNSEQRGIPDLCDRRESIYSARRAQTLMIDKTQSG